MPVGGTGGCDFATAPNHTARDTTVFWAPEVDTGVVLLTAARPKHPTDAVRATVLPPGEVRHASDGIYLSHGHGRATAYSVLLDQSRLDRPVAAFVPFDKSAAERFAASERLWRMAEGGLMPDRRLTQQRRRRLRAMLRAVDGSNAHASHRQIAEAIFGKARVSAELWHDSSLRYATMRLLRDGQAMVDGGYRNLLNRCIG